MMHPGMRSVCVREVQKSLKESAKKLVEDKLEKFGLGEAQGWKVLHDRIEAPGGGLIMFQGMKDHTAESIKSLEGVGTAWVEEAQSMSERSLELLRPTIRADGSEIWFSWNPRSARDPVDKMLRGPNVPSGAKVVRCNWSDNPWFPKVLKQERLDCLEQEPDKYGHIWEGEYARVIRGAYFAQLLEVAERDGRIGMQRGDDLLTLHTFWDIGGTSRKSDATTIWVVQYVGNEIRVLDYYEAVGQEFADHVAWLRSKGYDRAIHVLPHDGHKHDIVHRATPRGALIEAGLTAEVLPNQGAGAAQARIAAARAVLPRCTFDRTRTEPGREALAWYHARIDDERGIDLGPEHDWASHAADAFGLMALHAVSRKQGSTAKGWEGEGALKRNLKGFV